MISKKNIGEIYQKFLNKTAKKEDVEQLLQYLETTEHNDVLMEQMEEVWHQDYDHMNYDGQWKEVMARLDQLKKEVSNRKVRKTTLSRRKVWQMAAAILLMIVSGYWVWQQTLSPRTLTYKTGFGETETIELPDGSVVTLNANSQLTWLNHWKKYGSRQVTLYGEAFFDVSHIENEAAEKYPFEVVTEDMTIQVLGTTFNVNNRRNKTDVFLETGKIALKYPDAIRESEALEPGEMVTFSKRDGSYDKKETTIVKSASWTEGSFIYDSEKLINIISEIEDIYGKSIEVEDADLLEKQFTVGLPYANWEMVVESLALMMKLEIEEKEDGIIIKK